MVIVNVEACPVRTWEGVNVLLTLTPGRLVNDACVGSGLLIPFKVVTAPAGIRFVKFPLTAIVTRRVNVQLVLGGRVPPLNKKDVLPGLPVKVPPQVPTFNVAGLAICIPMPSSVISSVNAIPTRVALLGLINWTLNVEDAPP